MRTPQGGIARATVEKRFNRFSIRIIALYEMIFGICYYHAIVQIDTNMLGSIETCHQSRTVSFVSCPGSCYRVYFSIWLDDPQGVATPRQDIHIPFRIFCNPSWIQ